MKKRYELKDDIDLDKCYNQKTLPSNVKRVLKWIRDPRRPLLQKLNILYNYQSCLTARMYNIEYMRLLRLSIHHIVNMTFTKGREFGLEELKLISKLPHYRDYDQLDNRRINRVELAFNFDDEDVEQYTIINNEKSNIQNS